MKHVAVVGAGAWGTAFAVHLSKLGLSTSIWCREEKTAEDISLGENCDFLPGIAIPKDLRPSTDLGECLEMAEAVFFAIPVQFLDSVLSDLDRRAFRDGIIVNLAKGIEQATGRFPSQILEERLGTRGVLALSGPSFAEEVALGRPTVLVCAGEIAHAKEVQRLISSETLRIYRSEDRLGVEISSALKNVLALAAGMCDGLGLGENARAALIVRGLAELRRLALAVGAKEQTIFGIAGLGDLVLTCTSGKSRNHDFGRLLAKGNSAEEIISKHNWVAEGVFTAPAALKLAYSFGVELPITYQVVEVIEGRTTAYNALKALMTRPLIEEFPK